MSPTTKRTKAAYQELRSHLAYLKLGAASERLAAHLERAQADRPGYTEFLEELMRVEVEATEARRLERRLRFAGFPRRKPLEAFDFAAQPALDRRLVDELATLRFVAEADNAIFIGPPGVGKTTLAIGLGLRAVEAAIASTTRPPPTWSRGRRARSSTVAGRRRCASGRGRRF